MTLDGTRVLVVGGGFSGLSAAIALARTGCTVELVERQERWTMDGAGISIGSATLRALDNLGVLGQFFEHGAGVDGTEVRTPAGDVLTSHPSQRLVSPDLPGNGAIMRPLLGRILVEAAEAAGAHLRLGMTAEVLTDTDAHVEVGLSDGTRATYDLVVGADGISSTMRERLLPDAPRPQFSGQGAWRAIVPRPAGVDRTIIWVGATKVGVNPISATEMYLFVNENATARERVTDDELLPRLRALIEPFPDPLLKDALASLGDDSLVLYRPMDNLLVPLPWHRGRAVLIGDAVHATTPHLAAGAGIGIEDAIVLAEELAAASTVEDGLTAFESRRWERCRMVVESSARLGELEATPGNAEEHARVQGESFRALAEAI